MIFAIYPNSSYASPRGDTEPDAWIELELGAREIYEGEPVKIQISLVTDNPDVRDLREITPLSAKGKRGEGFASLQTVDNPGRAQRIIVDGKTYYRMPLQIAMASFPEEGSYKINGGEYEAGVSVPIVYNDPFWGPRRGAKLVNIRLKAPEEKLKVRALPNIPSEMNYSGSVGQFSIETILPKAKVFVGEEAIALVVLRGEGLIAELTMPEYREAFSGNVKLKSVEESRNGKYSEGKMISELILECTFVPDSREDCVIGEISFDYFDPKLGKFKKVVSKPVEIKVESSTSKREKLTV